MQVLIRVKGEQHTSDIEDHIRRRINTLLARFHQIIRKIEVFLTDENGPKGGIDKNCVIKIKTDHHSDIIIKDLEENTHTVVAKALARAKLALSKQNKRTHTFSRQRIQLDTETEVTPDV